MFPWYSLDGKYASHRAWEESWGSREAVWRAGEKGTHPHPLTHLREQLGLRGLNFFSNRVSPREFLRGPPSCDADGATVVSTCLVLGVPPQTTVFCGEGQVVQC